LTININPKYIYSVNNTEYQEIIHRTKFNYLSNRDLLNVNFMNMSRARNLGSIICSRFDSNKCLDGNYEFLPLKLESKKKIW